jgi:hypothetical protein
MILRGASLRARQCAPKFLRYCATARKELAKVAREKGQVLNDTSFIFMLREGWRQPRPIVLHLLHP